MLEQVQQQIAAMVARGYEPGGIVMTPPEMKRFVHEARPSDGLLTNDSRWVFHGLPLYRSWEISGPAVVSRDVLRALLKLGRLRTEPPVVYAALTEFAESASLDPVLF